MNAMMASSSRNVNKNEERGGDLHKGINPNDRLISVKTAMFLLGIRSLDTLKRYERDGLLKIYRFNARNWKCKLGDVLAAPGRIETRQLQPMENYKFLTDMGFQFN
jgi:hypothetical protein